MPNRLFSKKIDETIQTELALLMDEICNIPDKDLMDFYKIVFSSVLRTIKESNTFSRDILRLFKNKYELMKRAMTDFYINCPKKEIYNSFKTGL